MVSAPSFRRPNEFHHHSIILCMVFLGQVDPNWLISKGAETGRIVWICRALALNADRNTVCSNAAERTPVHLAVLNVNSFADLI